jgi:WD40 repeat protein
MKSCPRCSFDLLSIAATKCPGCGLDLSLNESKTLRDDDSGATLRNDDAGERPDDEKSAPTVRIPVDPESNDPAPKTVRDDELESTGLDHPLAEVDASAPTIRDPVASPADMTSEIDDDDELFSEDNSVDTEKTDASAPTIKDPEPVSGDITISEIDDDDELFSSSDETEIQSSSPTEQESPGVVSKDTIAEIDADDELFSDDSSSDFIVVDDADPANVAADETINDDDDLFDDAAANGETAFVEMGAEELGDDDDLSFLIKESQPVADFENDDATILLTPLHTMSRPQIDPVLNSTLPRSSSVPPESSEKGSGPGEQTIRTRNARTIVNPQAALEAAEAYSEGLQSLIPPRTMVRKEESAEHSDYQVIKKLGAGAFGVVFRARQVPLERSVAIKLLQSTSEDEAHQQRIKSEFLREAQFTGRLEHPNIVPIHDIGLTVSVNGKVNPFYVMKEIRGQSWHGEIREKPLKENLEVFKNVVNAIGFAHSQNILHCDLKPDNVMLGEFGEVLVVDWGQAVDLSVAETMRPGGTPAYISPEMAQYWIDIYLDRKSESPARANVGFRSDVYLLGAILFEIVSGNPPHSSQSTDSPYDVIRQAAKNKIVEHGECADEELMQIALAALRATDGKHLETIEELSAAIEQYENRSLSIDLRQRADELLEQAKKAADYDDYQRARFGYEESIQKWDGNQLAIEGLRDSKVSCAKQALVDQNFDLGLDVLQEADGSEEQEIRQQLLDGKRIRDRRKRLVYGLAAGLAASILLGIAVNGYMIDTNVKLIAKNQESIVERDNALQQKADIQASIVPLQEEALAKEQEIEVKKQEIANKQSQIDEFPAKIAAKETEFKIKEEDLKNKMVAKVEQYNRETTKLEEQKDELVGKITQLNQSSKFLRYKSDLNQIQADLDNGEFREARRKLDNRDNQEDWEIKRLNLAAHREVQSFYPDQPVQSIAFANGQNGGRIAVAFSDRVDIREVANPAKVLAKIDLSGVTAVDFSADGRQLFIGQLAANERSAGKITSYNVTETGVGPALKSHNAQSGSIDEIVSSKNGNVMLATGRVSKLRQSAGIGLEEPLMVWANGKPIEVDLVLPNGRKPKLDSAVLSDSGQRILLVNRSGIDRDQSLHVFERTQGGFQWFATCPIVGVSAATFVSENENAVIVAATDPKNGDHALLEWRCGDSKVSQTAELNAKNRPSNLSVIAPVDSEIVRLHRDADYIVATDMNRQTTAWDWRTKENIQLRGHSRTADICFVIPGSNLFDCKIITAATGEQAELLVTDLSTYQLETKKLSAGWFAADKPASIISAAFPTVKGKSIQAFGNNRGMASVIQDGQRVQWNLSAGRLHVASDKFLFAQSEEDFIYVFDRKTGALVRVLTRLALALDGQERVTNIQVSADGKTALIQTDSQKPEFRIWNLVSDRLIRQVDYGSQNLFETGSQKQLAKLKLSRDGEWVVGAKVRVYAWETGSGQLTRYDMDSSSAPRSTVNSIVFVRDSDEFLVSWGDRVARFTPTRKTKLDMQRFPTMTNAPRQSNLLDAIQLDGSSQFLAVSGDGGIAWLSFDKNQPNVSFEGATHASFFKGEQIGAIAGGLAEDGKLQFQSIRGRGRQPQKVDIASLVSSVGFDRLSGFKTVLWSPDNSFLLQSTERNKQSVRRSWNSIGFDIKDDTTQRSKVKVLASPVVRDIATDGNRVATLSEGQLHFWKLSEEAVKPDGVYGEFVSALCLSSDQKWLAVGTDDGQCKILDFATGTERTTVVMADDNSPAQITSLSWAGDSKHLAIGNTNGKVFLSAVGARNNEAGSPRPPLKLTTQIDGPIADLAFSRDGLTLLATISNQGTAIALSDLESDEGPTETVLRHIDDQKIITADISSSGKRAVTGASRGRLAVWNIEPTERNARSTEQTKSTERLLMRLANLHQSPLTVARFAELDEGETIVSAESKAGDNQVIFWPTSPTTTERRLEDSMPTPEVDDERDGLLQLQGPKE